MIDQSSMDAHAEQFHQQRIAELTRQLAERNEQLAQHDATILELRVQLAVSNQSLNVLYLTKVKMSALDGRGAVVFGETKGLIGHYQVVFRQLLACQRRTEITVSALIPP